jgi:hypothetical protein
VLSYANFINNFHDKAVVYCKEKMMTLDYCHFIGNSNPVIGTSDGGRFTILNCYLSSSLPDNISYSLTSNNVIDANAATLPLCNSSTIECRTFVLVRSSILASSSRIALSSHIHATAFTVASASVLFRHSLVSDYLIDAAKHVRNSPAPTDLPSSIDSRAGRHLIIHVTRIRIDYLVVLLVSGPLVAIGFLKWSKGDRLLSDESSDKETPSMLTSLESEAELLAAGADDAGASDVEPATSCESWKP